MIVTTLAAVALAVPSTVAVTEKTEHSLGNEATRISLDVPQAALAAVSEPRRLRVVVEGLKLVHPGAFYQVFLNLPEGRPPDPEGPYYLGNIAIFGKVREDDPGGSRSFDVTDNVRALLESDEYTGRLELTFLRGNPEQAPAAAGVAEPQEFIRFTRVSIVER